MDTTGSPTQIIEGRFVSARAGDFIEIETSSGRQRLLLYGIDAPEREQRFHFRAAEELESKLKNQYIRAKVIDSTRGPSPSAWIWVAGAINEEETGTVNYHQVAEGWAWVHRSEADGTHLATAQADARARENGLWKDDDPIPPWAEKERIPQATIVSAIRAHFDLLESLTTWILLSCVLASWASFRRSNEIQLAGLTISSNNAAAVATALYTIANFYVFILIWRATDLLCILDAAGINEAVWTLGVHTWIFNPFSIGQSLVLSKSGLAMLILLWWFATLAVMLLETSANPHSRRVSRKLRLLFPVLGALQIVGFGRAYMIVMARRSSISLVFSDQQYALLVWTLAMALFAMIVGYMSLKAVLGLRNGLFMNALEQVGPPR